MKEVKRYSGVIVKCGDEVLLCKRNATGTLPGQWSIPCGHLEKGEHPMDGVKREFKEETGIYCETICVIQNVLPFEETFIGTNHKSYKHKYFLAYMDEINDDTLNYQKTEVSKIEWKSFQKCLENIRPYNLEKKQLISNVHKLLNEYSLY